MSDIRYLELHNVESRRDWEVMPVRRRELT